MDIIKEYGTPRTITTCRGSVRTFGLRKLPLTSHMEWFKYNAKYTYCYCTKSSHFSLYWKKHEKWCAHRNFFLFDIPIARSLYERGKISKETYILCNSYSTAAYLQYITELLNDGFNCVPILDNMNEIETYEKNVNSTRWVFA